MPRAMRGLWHTARLHAAARAWVAAQGAAARAMACVESGTFTLARTTAVLFTGECEHQNFDWPAVRRGVPGAGTGRVGDWRLRRLRLVPRRLDLRRRRNHPGGHSQPLRRGRGYRRGPLQLYFRRVPLAVPGRPSVHSGARLQNRYSGQFEHFHLRRPFLLPSQTPPPAPVRRRRRRRQGLRDRRPRARSAAGSDHRHP